MAWMGRRGMGRERGDRTVRDGLVGEAELSGEKEREKNIKQRESSSGLDKKRTEKGEAAGKQWQPGGRTEQKNGRGGGNGKRRQKGVAAPMVMCTACTGRLQR